MNLYRLAVLFIGTFLLTGCAGTTVLSVSTPTPEPSPAPSSSDMGLHFLVGSSGNEPVQLKRLAQGWTDFHPAAWGTTVQRGDLIQPPPDGTSIILCADLSVHVISEETGSPCQVSQPDLFWDGKHIVIPMSPGQTIPFIVYPRSTRILEERPLLRWRDSGATSYTVAIIADGRAIWQETGVTGTELPYPDDAPPLEAGRRYLLEIKDENSGLSSAQEPLRGLGFTLLSVEETNVVRQKEADILALSLDAAGQQFALAVYYAGQELYGAALAALDEAIAAQESPQLWLWLGHVLVAMRLNAEAEAAYAAASGMAAAQGDLESQAQAEAQLWRMTSDEAYWDTAVVLYQQLGDAQAVADLQNNR
jgi:hypothetical protein